MGATRKGSGYSLQVLVRAITIAHTVGFSLLSLAQANPPTKTYIK
ncbi:hypothetical protein JCM19300_4265 [Algibacter lectus]|uniref:Uncharacterized protein n=1 Tax=Algibacter lectus TaxID=221126 RepID=A0A090VD47_9FLAO|nr:hypothetical protein JCM19300_4265 [Algibacter lectus]